jgi:hypothetical protein
VLNYAHYKWVGSAMQTDNSDKENNTLKDALKLSIHLA